VREYSDRPPDYFPTFHVDNIAQGSQAPDTAVIAGGGELAITLLFFQY